MLNTGTYKGHFALWIQNENLRVGVLPQKGADIFELTYLPDGIQFLMETPWGLKPPLEKPPADFLENYEGGWQELFPNHNDGCDYRSQKIPMHGEVALLPWEHQVLRDGSDETAVHFWVRCQKTPFLLERTMRMRIGEDAFEIEEKVTNESKGPCEFVWGHHITLGGGFLEDGCRFEAPAATLQTFEQLFESEAARLAPGQHSPWPHAQGRNGEVFDLRSIPGSQAHSHDDACLTGLEVGHYSVTNFRLGLRFSLDWDKTVFPWLMMWQPYGGAVKPPLTGIYGLGVEPWVSRYPLAEAVKTGQARILEGGQSLVTKLTATVSRV